MKRSLGLIVSGAILTAGLAVGTPTKANHETCEDAGKRFAYEAETYGERVWDKYGFNKEISSDEYDRCFIESFNKNAPEGYEVIVIKDNSEKGGGTTYHVIKKKFF
jgi:hypothetical protein